MHTPRNIQGGYVAADFWTQWSSANPRQSLFVKVTSKADFGSTVLGFTTNSRAMTLPGHSGVTFRPSSALMSTVVEQALGEAQNLELTGAYESNGFTREDVIAGKWAFASVEVFSASWNNTSLGELLHFKGNLGDFKDSQTYFTAEGRGLISRLSNDVNKVTQRLCRCKEFRDAECGHSASTVVIDAVTYNIVQVDLRMKSTKTPYDVSLDVLTAGFSGTLPPENFYKNGKITGNGGLNNGISREIAYSSAVIGDHIDLYLKRPFPYTVTTDFFERYDLTAGCDRTQEDCMKFTNIVRRRAEDFVPGIESISRLPPG